MHSQSNRLKINVIYDYICKYIVNYLISIESIMQVLGHYGFGSTDDEVVR